MKRLLLALLLALTATLPATAQPAQPAPAVRAPLRPTPVQELQPGKGVVVSLRIARDGRPVGLMARGEPNNPLDSGWIFLAEGEDPGTMGVSDLGIYDIDVVAAYDPAIRPYLDSPIGTALVRSGDRFVGAE